MVAVATVGLTGTVVAHAATTKVADPASLPIADSPNAKSDAVPIDTISAADAPPLAGDRTSNHVDKPGVGFDPQRSTVVPDLTTDRRQVFQNPDGTFTAQVTPLPSRVSDGKGGWRNVDLTLRDDGTGSLVPAVSPTSLTVAQDPAAGIVTAATPAGPMTVGLPDVAAGAGSATAKGSIATYAGKGVSVAVQPTVTGFESSVAYATADVAHPSYRTMVTVPDGVTAKATESGVMFFDAQGNEVATAASGMASDAEVPTIKAAAQRGAAALNTSVDVRLVDQTGPTVTLEYSVDPAWLTDPARVFPVVLDPTVTFMTASGGGKDTFVNSLTPTTSNWSNPELWVGAPNGFSDSSKTLIQFDLSSITASDTAVTDATLTLNSKASIYSSPSTCWSGNYVELYALGADFTPSTTWSNQPPTDGGYPWASKTMPTGNPSSSCSFGSTTMSITNLAKAWTRSGRPDTKTNFGLQLRPTYGDQATGEVFYSGETIGTPQLSITYLHVPDATPSAPDDKAIVGSDTPTLSVSAPGGLPNLRCVFRIATGSDAESGGIVAQSDSLPCGSGTGASFPVPKNLLADGQTYFWHTWVGDSTNLASLTVSPWVRSFSVNRRFGTGGPSPSDTAGPASVNLATGNVTVTAASPSFPTVAGKLGASFTYNSQRGVPHGLYGSYYNDPNLTTPISGTPVLNRVDQGLYFGWLNNGPTPDGVVHNDQYSVKWTGYLTVPTTASYTLSGNADDEFQIKLNTTGTLGTLIPWTTGAGSATSAVTLNANQPYPIEVDFHEKTGLAALNVLISATGVTNGAVPVPASWLTPEPPALSAGWSMSADLDGSIAYVKAVSSGGGSVALTAPDGAVENWISTGTGWVPPNGGDGFMTGTPGAPATGGSPPLTLTAADGQIYTFGTGGDLASVTSATELKKPTAVQFDWTTTADGYRRLWHLTDPVSGRYITATYSTSTGADPCPTNGTSTRPPAGMLCQLDYAQFNSGQTKLYYNSGGQLARIENPGSELTDFHYNSNGLLDWIKEPLALDMITAGKRTDDGTAQTDIAYKSSTDPYPLWASSVTSPAPNAGDARPQHSYSYSWFGVGVTDVHVAGASEPNGWARRVNYSSSSTDDSRRLLTDLDAANLATTYTYNNLADTVSSTTDPAGFEHTTIFDTRQRPIEAYGPAPTNCYDTTLKPKTVLPSGCPNPVPKSTTNYDENIKGLAANYWNNPNLAGAPKTAVTGVGEATGQLNQNWGTAAPVSDPSIPADGWSARYTGDITFDPCTPPTPCDYGLKIDAADNAGVRATIDGNQILSHWNGPNRPELVSPYPGHLDLFMRGPDNALWHKFWDQSASPPWSNWEELGGVLTSDPGACVRGSTGRIDVFVRGTDNAVWQRYLDVDGWHPWTTIGGDIQGAPDCASWDTNHVTVAARGNVATGNQLYTNEWTGPAWGGWTARGGTLTSSPSLVSWGANRVDVFVAGASSALYHTWYSSGWSGTWENKGTPLVGGIVGDPVAASWGTNRLDVFVRDGSDALEHRWFDTSAWGGYESLGGTLTTSPGATSASSYPTSYDVFTRGTDDQLWQDHYGTSWSGFTGQFPLFRTGVAHVLTSGVSTRLADGTINVIDPTIPHRLSVELADNGGAAKINLLWKPPGSSSYVSVPGDHLNARYGLVTSTVDPDGHKASTDYTGQGLDPALGLATSATVDPAGLNLTSGTTFETNYYRTTATKLPRGDLTDPNKRVSTVNYLGVDEPTTGSPAESRSMPADTGCASGTNIIQGGLVKLSTDPLPADASKQSWNETIYDAAARPAATRQNGDTRWTCTLYDARGRATDITDRNGNVTHTQYWGGASDPTCGTVDPNVVCTRFVDSAGTARFTKTETDLLRRVTKYTDEQGTETRTVYDQAGRPIETWRKLPGGSDTKIIATGYDTYNRPTTSTEYISSASGRVFTTGYDAAGRPSTLDAPTDTYPTRNTTSYDPATGRVSAKTTARNGTTFWTDGYSYTAGGKINLDWSTASLTSYTFDNAGRLTSAAVSGGPTRNYAYDANTNRCAQATSCGTPTYSYDNADRITASPIGSNYVYDTRGNLTGYTKVGGGAVTIQYDAFDHATRIDDGTTRVDETLAPTGRVLRRTVTSPPGGTVTEDAKYGYDDSGDSPEWAQSLSGGAITSYVPGDVITGTNPSYEVTNGHGDITATVSQAGAMTATAPVDEYGVTTGSVPSNRLGWLGSFERFTSAPSLGLIRMGVRLYDPNLGRFMQQDPVAGGSCNDYDYVCQDPINSNDLNGTYADGYTPSKLIYLSLRSSFGVGLALGILADLGTQGAARAVIGSWRTTRRRHPMRGQRVWRVYGGKKAPLMGRYWTSVNVLRFPQRLRAGLGLPDDNPCTKWALGVLSSPVGVIFGAAAPYDSEKYGKTWKGGLPELFFPGGPRANVQVVATGSMPTAC